MVASSSGAATEEPRCPRCGYSLVGLPEFRCPECGTAFDIEDVAARIHLLPWERPEVGRRLRRLRQTVLYASLHPGPFFATLSRRKDRRIASAGSFVAACAIASLPFYAAAFLLDRTTFFLRLTCRHVAPQQALSRTVRLLWTTASTDLFLLGMQVLPPLLSVFLVAGVLNRVHRSRAGALRTIDFAAVHSPAMVFGAFIAASALVIAALSRDSLWSLMVFGEIYGHQVVVLLLVWHCCRKLLLLGRTKTAATVVACGIVQFGCWAGVSGAILTVISG